MGLEIRTEELADWLGGPEAAVAAGRAYAGTCFRDQDQRENGGRDRQASPKNDGSVSPQGGVYDEVFHKWGATGRLLRLNA